MWLARDGDMHEWMCIVLSFILWKTRGSWWTRFKSGKTRELQPEEILQAPREWLDLSGTSLEVHAGLVRSKSAPHLSRSHNGQAVAELHMDDRVIQKIVECCDHGAKPQCSKVLERHREAPGPPKSSGTSKRT